MKAIIYLLIISLLAISLTIPPQKNVKGFKTWTIQATDNNATDQLLKQSAKIIGDRLMVYGLSSPDITVVSDQKQIKIAVPGDIQLEHLEGLLVSRGELAFYETLSIKGISDVIKSDMNFSPSDARVGCSTFEDPAMITKVEDYLKSNNFPSNYRLFWGLKNDKSLTCLFALKTNDAGKPLLLRSDVETINSSQDKTSETYKISMKFSKPSISLWADATRKNLNRPIAVVVGNKVFYAPVVKTPIESGLCEITGTFTKDDVSYFMALVNNPPLPLSFELVR